MHKTAGVRDQAAAFPLPSTRDDVQERRQANQAIAVSAVGLAATGIIELLLSNDTDLLSMSPWRGTPIIEPRAFAAKVDAMRRHARRPRR